jgi:hypothetical protein
MEFDPTPPPDAEPDKPPTPPPLPAQFDEMGQIIVRCECGHHFTTPSLQSEQQIVCPGCSRWVDVPVIRELPGSQPPSNHTENMSPEPAYSPARLEMETELRKWGIALCVIGGISILLSGFLDPVWGVMLIVLGLLSLVVRKCGMFIVFGCVLILAGIMNLTSGGPGGSVWGFFGIFQVLWGIQEFKRFGTFRKLLAAERDARG